MSNDKKNFVKFDGGTGGGGGIYNSQLILNNVSRAGFSSFGQGGGGASAPINTIAPVISGTTTLGSVLTTTNGTWTGSPAPTFTYQWTRNSVNIASATASTYTLVLADSGANINCVVTGTNASGSSSATSNTIVAGVFTASFISTWLVTAGETISLPYEFAGTYSGTIDWGDGTSIVANSYANRTHTYATAGTKTIVIDGVTTGFRFNNGGSRLNIRTITKKKNTHKNK